MNRSSSTNPDRPGGNAISGVTVVAGLVLLILAGSGFAVAMYLALGPYSLRRHAAAELAAEGRARHEPPAEADIVPPDAIPPDAIPLHAMPPDEVPPDAMPPDNVAAAKEDAEPREAQQPAATPSGVSLTQLTPLEIVGVGTLAGDWRGSVDVEGQAVENAVVLRPDEGQNDVQIAFRLNGRFVRLSGFVAVVEDDLPRTKTAQLRQSQAEFRVYGDGNLLWASEPLTDIGTRQTLACELRGTAILTLAAESQSSAARPRFVWGDLVLTPADKSSAAEPGETD